MKFSQLESSPESQFDFEVSGERPIARDSYRPIAPTLLDEELSSFQTCHETGGYGCAVVRSRPGRPLHVPPPPAPVRSRGSTARAAPSDSHTWSGAVDVASYWPPPSYRPASTPPPPSWPAPSWSAVADVVGPEPVGRERVSRRLVAVLVLVAAGLMGASLWLSITGDRRAGRRPDVTHAGVSVDGQGAAAACEVDSADLVGRSAAVSVASPAPTLGPTPRRPLLVAPSSVMAAKRVEAPASAPAETAEKTALLAPAAKTAASGGLEQASRAAQMLREQLNSSVR